MDKTIAAWLDYLPRWIEYQMRHHDQPGCSLAVSLAGEPVLELALGYADIGTRVALTPRHRCRVASHSKTFTAAGVMKLREQGRLSLDDPIGRFVPGLHPEVAGTRISQLLSHSAGLVRDGVDASQWFGLRAFKTDAEVRAELENGPVIEPGLRFKYSNHGFALLGMAISAISNDSWTNWIAREIIAPAGLQETLPDAPVPQTIPFANGHSALQPLGRRLVVRNDMATHAIAPAGGVVSTASDLARFYASLDPLADISILSSASRRDMVHARWHEPDASLNRWYGLGLITSNPAAGGQSHWFGHSGAFPGTVSRTAVLPAFRLTLSIITNAADGMANAWLDGAISILRAFRHGGAPSAKCAHWHGRWWSPWAAYDLVPMHDQIALASPALLDPFLDAPMLAVDDADQDQAKIVRAPGLGSYGEPASLQRDQQGQICAVQVGPLKMLSEQACSAALIERFQAG